MFIDTSGWFLVFDSSDSRHLNAVSKYKAAGSKVTHSFVIDELVSLCNSRRLRRDATLKFVDHLLDDERVEVVWVDERLIMSGLALLADRLDKSWSLCDAVSFLIMQERNISVALTTDHHFEQAGFERAIKD